MSVKELSLLIGGIFTFLMAIFHCFFPRIFKWEKDYQRISGTNKRIFFTIHIALLLLFFIMGIITVFYYKELSNGRGVSFSILLFITLFWFWRTIWQVAYFKPEKGSRLVFMHWLLTVVFFILAVSYLLPLIV
jgi:4-hydroxybenzoate polyprenyltransferase